LWSGPFKKLSGKAPEKLKAKAYWLIREGLSFSQQRRQGKFSTARP